MRDPIDDKAKRTSTGSDKSTTEKPDGFLGRWSRRKRQEVANADSIAAENLLDATRPLEEIDAVEEARAANAENEISPDIDNRVLTDEDMPPLDTLDGDSDYSPFFSEGVSKQLRNMALKRLFFSGRFALRDGLDDYDDDFTRFEPLGGTITSDMKFHQRRKEKARLAKLEEEERARAARQEEAQENAAGDKSGETEQVASAESQSAESADTVCSEDVVAEAENDTTIELVDNNIAAEPPIPDSETLVSEPKDSAYEQSNKGHSA